MKTPGGRIARLTIVSYIALIFAGCASYETWRERQEREAREEKARYEYNKANAFAEPPGDREMRKKLEKEYREKYGK